jgi:hypothetical protein
LTLIGPWRLVGYLDIGWANIYEISVVNVVMANWMVGMYKYPPNSSILALFLFI